MKKMCLVMTLLVLVLAGTVAVGNAAEAEKEFLFVQSASLASVEGDNLVLTGVVHTVYFSDRPDRVVGVMSNEALVQDWPVDTPPNASLAILADPPVTVVLELSDPVADGDVVSYQVKVLEGELPELAGPCSLFIDAFPTAVNNQITD